MTSIVINSPLDENQLVELAENVKKAFEPVTKLVLAIKKPLFVGDREHIVTGAVFMFDDDSICILGVTDIDRLLVTEVPIKNMPLIARLDFVKATCHACDLPLTRILESAVQQAKQRRALRARDDA